MKSRRQFLSELGISAAALPFVAGLPSLGYANQGASKKRLIFVCTPNGTIPKDFWPDAAGSEFELKRIMEPLAAFKDRLLPIHGVDNKVRGDGDNHMRGMSCLLTAIELFPGNIQGGSHTPAGWASGISIDQEIKNHLQKSEATRTRFGSLEIGVEVPGQADPWTRWVYSGPNKPVAPINDPYQLFSKLYGQVEDKDTLKSILDDVREDLKRVRSRVSNEDRHLLEEHAEFVRAMEKELNNDEKKKLVVPAPELAPGVRTDNDNIPELSRMQIDLMVNALVNDMNRVATLQYTKSVGQARMRWLGIDDGHHGLSHEPDSNEEAQEKLVKINQWFAGELAYLMQKLKDTPDPGTSGNMLDNTLIVWTNELGKGNSHTLNDIPFVLMGGDGFGFKMGQSLKQNSIAHNRLYLSIANAMGHEIETFGKKELCDGGALALS